MILNNQVNIALTSTEAYSELSQRSKIKLFGKIFHNFRASKIFAKNFILDIWHGSEYASGAVIIFCIVETESSIMLLNIYRMILETTVECKIYLTFTCGNWFFPLERNETFFGLGNFKSTHFSWYWKEIKLSIRQTTKGYSYRNSHSEVFC